MVVFDGCICLRELCIHSPQDGRIEIYSPLLSNDRVEKEEVVLEKAIEPADAVHAMVINGDKGEVMIPVRFFSFSY